MSGEIGPNNALDAPNDFGLIADGHAVGHDPGTLDTADDFLITEQKNFGIRLADTERGRNSSSMLINKMYAWRG